MRNLFALLMAAALPLFPARAAAGEPFFDETFKDPVYEPGSPVPVGLNVIRHGQWLKLGRQVRPGVVALAGGEPAVELRAGPGPEQVARLLGRFGRTNQETSSAESALRVTVTFQVSGPLNDTFYIQVLGGEGKSKGVLSMNEDGRMTVSFGGEREILGDRIEPGTWYTAELLLPPHPKTKSVYTATLYGPDGTTRIDSKKGVLSRSVEENGGNYHSIDIQHRVPDQSLFIRSIRAEAIEAP